MGAAIENFGNRATALVVPRTRFSPVKTCADLLALRSDCYVLSDDGSISLSPQCDKPPVISLDDRYKLVDAFETLVPNGAPSLVACSRLKVKGLVEFARGCVFVGTVEVLNPSDECKTLPAGVYTDTTVEL